MSSRAITLGILILLLAYQNCTNSFHTLSLSKSDQQSGRNSNFAVDSQIIPVAGGNAGAAIYSPGSGGAGFNTMLVSHFLNAKYGLCKDCPAWIYGMSKSSIQEAMAAVKGTSLNHYREIVEATRFFPSAGTLSNVDDLVEMMKIYQDQGATVMLSLGTPIPSWMNPELAATGAISYQPNNPNLAEGGRVCFLPKSDAVWEVLKNNMSQSFGLLMKALWNDSRLNKEWLRKQVWIDPINEFDSFAAGPECDLTPAGRNLYASGRRAASLTGGIQYVLNQYQLPFVVTMPSGATGTLEYFSDFYKYGGQAMANIHAYFPRGSLSADDPAVIDNLKSSLISYLRKVRDVVPEPYKSHLVLGEYGNYFTESSYCSSANQFTEACAYLVKGAPHEKYLYSVLTNPEIKALAPVRMVWQGVDSGVRPTLSEIEKAGATAGFLRTDISPKPSLHYYLQQVDGINISTDRGRLAGFRGRVKMALGMVSETVVDAFVLDWIYQKDTWANLVARYKYNPMPTATPSTDLCVGSAGQAICAAYMSLFNRQPEASSMAYWKAELTIDGTTPRSGFPQSCWKHQIIKGTSGSDCQTYMSKFAPRDMFGRQVGWVPSAGCMLPQYPSGINYYAPGCYVLPSDAETPCPGSPDPGGTSQAQKNLCLAYSELYMRSPDPGGYDYWLPQLSGKSVACMKKTLAPGTSTALDCQAFKSLYGFDAPSSLCGGTTQTTFGCVE